MDLPVLPHNPRCPAAFPIRGASRAQQGVVCRLMRDAVESDPGERMTAGALGRVRETIGGVYLTAKSDPATVLGFCYGDALPVLTDDDDKRLARASFTRCPVWQAEKNRIAEGRDALVEEEQPEPVSMGVSSSDAPDPWSQARRDLDLLAPESESSS